jgi:hypothetical protein
MPISIPTNIAGISVSGITNGPLNALYKNKYQKATYNYPRDVGTNPAKSHVIRFTTFVPSPTNSRPTITSTFVAPAVNAFARSQATGLDADPLDPLSGAGLLETGRAAAAGIFEQLSGLDVPRTIGKTISLYVPDTVNVTYGASYDDISLTESLGKAYFLAQAGVSFLDYFDAYKQGESVQSLANRAGGDPFLRNFLAGAIGQRIGAQNLPELAAKQLGQAINPQLQVLFRGIGFRSFQFDFVFTPFSKEESDVVKKIIKEFKSAAAPEIKPNRVFNQGVFLDVPDLFGVQFFYKNKENTNVHKIGKCVLENINVDYAPNGWSTFNDGSPVQTRLTLQFKEIEIIDKTKIEQGY